MKKMIPLIALSAISMPAIAVDNYGFYGSIGGGAYRLKADGFNETAPTAVLLAGYNFSDTVAVEGAYTRLFDASDTVDGTRVKIDGNAWDLSTKLSYPMGKRFSPYGRIGWSYVDLSAVAREGNVSARSNDYADAFSWGVGTGVRLNKRFAMSGEYSRVLVNYGDFDRMSLNLNYTFGAR